MSASWSVTPIDRTMTSRAGGEMKRITSRNRIVVIAALALGFAALAFHPVAFADDKHQGDENGFEGYRRDDNHSGDGSSQWVGTWATSPQATNAVTFNNQTLRM